MYLTNTGTTFILLRMDWKNIVHQLSSSTGFQLFCLHGTYSPSSKELRNMINVIKLSGAAQDGGIAVVMTRSQYINRHQYEGQFFQQRYQASFKDHGETVRQRIENASRKNPQISPDRWIREFDLHPLFEKPLVQLSSGEWQRFSVCEMLIGQPKLLVIPDLLKGLDSVWQIKILDILKTAPGKVLFTSDVPVKDSAIQHIRLDGTNHNVAFPALNPGLIAQFHQYQTSFLSNSREEVQIEMKDVNIQYGQMKILENIHWRVLAGQKWNIQGPNGAGKSTLISLVNSDNPQGYSQPIHLFGHKFGQESIWDRKARISYFGSDFFAYYKSGKTVEESFYHLITTPYIETIQPPPDLVSSLFHWFGLSKKCHQPFALADRNTRRQVMLLAAYLKSSGVLILDEPFQDFSLDKIQQNIHFLDSVQINSLQTVIFVTHQDHHKPQFLDQILRLDQGKMV